MSDAREAVARELDSLREYILDLTTGQVNPEAVNRAFRDHEEGILEALRSGGGGGIDHGPLFDALFSAGKAKDHARTAIEALKDFIIRNDIHNRPYRPSTETDAPGEGLCHDCVGLRVERCGTCRDANEGEEQGVLDEELDDFWAQEDAAPASIGPDPDEGSGEGEEPAAWMVLKQGRPVSLVRGRLGARDHARWLNAGGRVQVAEAVPLYRRSRPEPTVEGEDVIEYLREKSNGAQFSAHADEAILASAALSYTATVLASANDSPCRIHDKPTEGEGDDG